MLVSIYMLIKIYCVNMNPIKAFPISQDNNTNTSANSQFTELSPTHKKKMPFNAINAN